LKIAVRTKICTQPNITRIESRRVSWLGHTGHMGNMYKILVGKPKGNGSIYEFKGK
jgi:hypothetical protein